MPVSIKYRSGMKFEQKLIENMFVEVLICPYSWFKTTYGFIFY